MISAPDRQRAISLVTEAKQAGVCTQKACEALAISLRTYQRWSSEEGVKIDARPHAERPVPANKLSEQERRQILAICNQEEYSSLPPS
jgi:hypothetical protein